MYTHPKKTKSQIKALIDSVVETKKKNDQMIDNISKAIFALDHADEMLYPKGYICLGQGEYITKKTLQSAFDKYQEEVAKQCVSPSFYVMSENLVQKVKQYFPEKGLVETEPVAYSTFIITDQEMKELDITGMDIVSIDGKPVVKSFHDLLFCKTVYFLED